MRSWTTPKTSGTATTLYRLVYHSREAFPRDASDHDPDFDIERKLRALVSHARSHNRAENVTGALLFTGTGFCQVLEGPRDAVDRIFERINADPRHAGVKLLSFIPVASRRFPDWPMGFCDYRAMKPDDPVAPIRAEVDFAGAPTLTGSDVLGMLERIVQHEDECVDEAGVESASET